MVIPALLRPAGSANKDERAKRKRWEKEHPHFKMQEFGLKAGVLALMGAVALYPWEKEREKEREGDDDKRGGDEHRRRGGAEGTSEREGRNGRGKSLDGGQRRRGRDEYGHEYDGRRRRSVAGSRATTTTTMRDPGVGGGVRRVVTDDIHPQRETVDARRLRMAVADGYEYIPARGNNDGTRTRRRRNSDVFSSGGERRGVRDGIAEEVGRNRRGSGEVRFR